MRHREAGTSSSPLRYHVRASTRHRPYILRRGAPPISQKKMFLAVAELYVAYQSARVRGRPLRPRPAFTSNV